MVLYNKETTSPFGLVDIHAPVLTAWYLFISSKHTCFLTWNENLVLKILLFYSVHRAPWNSTVQITSYWLEDKYDLTKSKFNYLGHTYFLHSLFSVQDIFSIHQPFWTALLKFCLDWTPYKQQALHKISKVQNTMHLSTGNSGTLIAL